MLWIGGSDYQHKLELLIEEMLQSKQPVVFFVDDHRIVDYERLLLLKSKSNVCFHIEITSIEKYCYHLLKKQQLFQYIPFDEVQLHLLVKESLSYLDLTVLKDSNENSRMIKMIIQSLKEIDENQIKDANGIECLRGFSKQKIEDLIKIYQYVMKHKPSYHLFHNEIYRVALPYMNQNTVYYCDGLETLTKGQIELLNSLEGKTTMTSYASQVVPVSSFDQIINYKTDLKAHFSNYFNSKKLEIKSNPNVHFFKANHKRQEVEEVAYSIYHHLVDEQLQYQDFIVYVTDQQYLDIVEDVFAYFNLAINISNTISYKEYPIYQFIRKFFEYVKANDISVFSQMLYSQCFEGVFDHGYIDYINHCVSQNIELKDEKVINAKLKVNQKMKLLNNSTTTNEYTKVLYDWLNESSFQHLALQHPEAFVSIFRYLEEWMRIETKISLDDYIDIFNAYYLDGKKEEKRIDRIEINLLYQETSMIRQPKYLYVLGCYEYRFPKEIKHNGLILEEERELLSTKYNDISLARNEVQLYHTIIFKVMMQSDCTYLSYSSGSYQGDEFLPSLLYQHIQSLTNQKEELLLSDEDKIASKTQYKKESLLHSYFDDSYNQSKDYDQIKEMIDNYKQQKNQPENLGQDIAKQVYIKNDQLYTSSSQLETYNGCPYRHFLIYGLHVRPLKEQIVELSDIGTLQHNLLDHLTPLYQTKEIVKNTDQLHQMMQERNLNITNNTLEDIKSLIFDLLQEEVSKKPMLIKKIENDYTSSLTLQRVVDQTINHLLILMYHVSVGEFEILGTEQWVNQSLHHGVTLSGKVDRVDVYQDYLKVMDYKSSNKALDLGLAIQGFNMQMLVYLDMLSKTLQKKKGAVVYFNLSKRNIKAKEKLSIKKESFDDFIKEYRMQGYLVNDAMHTVISGIDNDYSNGSSSIVNMRYVKTSNEYKGNLLDEQEMDGLLNLIKQRIEEITERIFINGDIGILPSSHEKSAIKMKVNPCRFCEYQAICQKDVFYNQERMINDYKAEEIKKKLRGEDQNESN